MQSGIKYLEPRVNVVESTGKSRVVSVGGKFINVRAEPSTNYGSINSQPVSATWTVQPPTGSIVDRHMKIRYYIEVESVGGDMKLGLDDGPRQCPLSSIIDYTQVSLNQQQVNDNTAQGLHAMLCYGHHQSDRNKRISTTPAQPDQAQDYDTYAQDGTARNVFGKYGENCCEPSRGGFPVEIVTGTPTLASKIRYVVTEPLFISPCLNGEEDEEGFVHVNQLDVEVRFKSDVSRFMSHSSTGNAITGFTVTQYKAPELLVTYIQPQDWQIVPPLQVIDYTKLLKRPRIVPDLAPGASDVQSSEAFRLNQIPNRMWVFVAHQSKSATFSDSDSFCRIDKLEVEYNNNNGILSAATPQDLYDMSVRNGCNLDFSAFSKYRGSVVCASFANDIGMSTGEAPGVISVNTITVNVSYTNMSKVLFKPELFVVFEMQGTLTIVPGSASVNLGNLTMQEVVETKMSSAQLLPHQYEQLTGGSFWSSLKSIVNTVAKGVGMASGPASTVASIIAPELVPVIETAGCVAKGVTALTGGKQARRTIRRR